MNENGNSGGEPVYPDRVHIMPYFVTLNVARGISEIEIFFCKKILANFEIKPNAYSIFYFRK